MDFYVAAGIVSAITVAPCGFFKLLEDAANPHAKRSLSTWLTKLDSPGLIREGPRFHSVLQAALVGIFTADPFRWIFIRRSALLTAIGVVITLGIWQRVRYPDEWSPDYTSPVSIAAAYLGTFVMAFVPDYLSLARTVILIQSEPFKRHYVKGYFLDVASALATAVGWVASILLAIELLHGIVSERLYKAFDTGGSIVSFALYTSCIPTFFTLSFVLSVPVAKFFLHSFNRFSNTHLSPQEKPFLSLGFALTPLAFVLGIVVVIIHG